MSTRPKKLSLIPDPTRRKASFKKRKRGIQKKLDEITTLCDVKACAVINSPFEKNPVVWPSKEGIKEVVSEFQQVPEYKRYTYMVNLETYLKERIGKATESLRKLREENYESQLKQIMFDCLIGTMKVQSCNPMGYDNLIGYIDSYLKRIEVSMQLHAENGESSSLPPPPASVDGVDPPAVHEHAGPSNELHGYFPYDNMNLNLSNHEVPVQHQVLTQNQNQQGPVQYNPLINFNDETAHRFSGMSLHQNMSQDPYQGMYQQSSFMNLLAALPQQMGYVGEHAHVPYQQQPTIDLAATGHMPVITTTMTNTSTPA
ncbi:hypothetical protein CARUB_v10011611mg, partial [Capsella rubella]